MEGKTAEKEVAHSLSHKFFTPVKAYHDESQNKSTTANFNSQEQFSFEKLIHRQNIALKYCSANLNELLASDIKFKSPANALKQTACTPAKKDWDNTNFFAMVDDFEDSAARFISNKLNLDMSINKDPMATGQLRDEQLLEGPVFYIPGNLEFNIPCSSDFSVDDSYMARGQPLTYRQHYASYYASHEDNMQSDDYRKRKRKNNVQLKVLKAEFSKCDNWDKDKITYVARITGLSESQVYKWCWDQKKKVEEQENGQKPLDSDRFKPELNLKPLAYDFNKHESLRGIDYAQLRDNIAKRKPDRQPLNLMPVNRQ